MDFAGDADALATRFGTVATPAGESIALASSTADPPNALSKLPAIVVFLEDGEYVTGNGTRAGGIAYLVRFYLAETADLPREGRRLLLWAGVLVDMLKGAAQLAGRVAVARVDGFTVGLLPYGNRQFAGIELNVTVTTSEAWGATA